MNRDNVLGCSGGCLERVPSDDRLCLNQGGRRRARVNLWPRGDGRSAPFRQVPDESTPVRIAGAGPMWRKIGEVRLGEESVEFVAVVHEERDIGTGGPQIRHRQNQHFEAVLHRIGFLATTSSSSTSPVSTNPRSA